MPRTLAVWAGPWGIDQVTAAELSRVGVDEVVVPRGSIELAGEVPVVRTGTVPAVAEGIPIAASFRLVISGDTVKPRLANTVWNALSGELNAAAPPVALLLELPHLPEGTGELVRRLADVSGLRIVPVLSADQVRSPEAARVARAAGSCTVVAFGQVALWRKGSEPVSGALRDALEPLASAGVPVRTGLVIAPWTDPPLDSWGDDLAPLTEPENATIGDDPVFERRFTFRRAMDWSGRSWTTGQGVSITWTDAATLDAAIAESSHTTRPPCGGWDLLWVPPASEASLGIGLEALIAYLDGNGPAPAPMVRAERHGRTIRVVVENPSPFPSAVSRFGNWFELDGEGTALVAEDRGAFDGVTPGTRRGGRFRRVTGGVADAVRFTENHLAPGETIRSGPVRVTGRRTALTLRWQVQLSDGRTVSGSTPIPGR